MPELLLSYDDPMFRIIEIRRHAEGGSERVRGVWHHAVGQPNWIARIALTVFLFIVILPIIALLLIAFLIALAVFLMLAVVNAVIRAVRVILPGSSHGRENVRVIRRGE